MKRETTLFFFSSVGMIPLYRSAVLWQALYMEKDFTGWSRLKAEIQSDYNAPIFQQREIWWCAIGVNIGHEEDGKGECYSRPVLIVRKFNSRIFWGVPLTTQIKNNPYYYQIHFKGREQCVMLSQLRIWEARRLTDKMGQLATDHFKEILKELRKILV